MADKRKEDDIGSEFDPFALLELKIGEINLPALCLAYKVIRSYWDILSENRRSGTPENEDLYQRVIEYISMQGPRRNERELAMMMVFEEEFDRPRRQKIMEELYGRTDQNP